MKCIYICFICRKEEMGLNDRKPKGWKEIAYKFYCKDCVEENEIRIRS
jgi:hypothetical protein